MKIKKVLCVCYGNSDRSPAMAAVLGMFLKNAGHNVVVESAGVGESAEKRGGASPWAMVACNLVGLDLTGHIKRRTTSLNLNDYDLIICADDYIVAQLLGQGANVAKIYNVSVSNGQWPFKFQDDYDKTFQQILSAMYRVVSHYFITVDRE